MIYTKTSENIPSICYENIVYETKVGSTALKCCDDNSDLDIVSIFMPPYEFFFPNKFNQIPGFDKKNYTSYAFDTVDRQTDITCYSIPEFFYQCGIKGNPYIIESLYTGNEFVTHNSEIAQLIRDNRHLFISEAMAKQYFTYIQELKLLYNSSKLPKIAYKLIRLLDILEMAMNYDIVLNRHSEKYLIIKAGKYEYKELILMIDDQVTRVKNNVDIGKLGAVRAEELRKLLSISIQLYYNCNY